MAITTPGQGAVDADVRTLASLCVSLETRLSVAETSALASTAAASLTTRISTEEAARATAVTSLNTRVANAESVEAAIH